MAKKSSHAKKNGTAKVVAKLNEFVPLSSVGHVQMSILPKSKDYQGMAVFLKFGFKSPKGIVIPVTKANLDEIRGAMDIIEAQCL